MGASLLIDDRRARIEADRLAVDYFGSLKILQEAKQRGLIPGVKPSLDQLIASGMFVSRELYRSLLKKNGEE
jgi:predicted nucleic acid-binding protein